MNLRPATEADLPGMVRLGASTQALHAKHVPAHVKMPSGDPGYADLLRSMLSSPKAFLLVAEEGGPIIGHLFAQEVRRDENWVRPALHSLVLEHIAVDPGFRRKGIGHALVEGFLEEARRRGIAHVELVCWNFNEEARRFFRQHGFATVYSRLDRHLSP